MPVENFSSSHVKEMISNLSDKPEDLKHYLDKAIPFIEGPAVTDFSPRKGPAGTAIDIHGRNFSATREENEVTIGGRRAVVVRADPDRLRVITDLKAKTGPVEVSIGDHRATAPYDFMVTEPPGAGEDGPPVYFEGCKLKVPGHAPSIGTLRVLFVLVHPSDKAPKEPAKERADILKTAENIRKFYDQASYSRLKVAIDINECWHALEEDTEHYIDESDDDFRCSALDQLMAEAAAAAGSEGLKANDYDTMACIVYLGGIFVRGRGGWTAQNFSHHSASRHINITSDHPVNLMVIQESADWGRFAHEIAHGIASRPPGLKAPWEAAVLSEDVYSTDLVDPSVATAQDFDLMGRHDRHPLFSGYYMDHLGWYGESNIETVQWSRDAFSKDYEVVAHGLVENEDEERCHLVKIRVSEGLYYYIEARRRPCGDQIFDERLPVGDAKASGGVVVTKVLTGLMNVNQQMRFITLMQESRVLPTGEEATDPERSLKITVLDDRVEDCPLVCSLRVEWSKGDLTDPNGAYDLWIQPWDDGWETPDIWIDRMPFGVYDEPLDEEGRPGGNGDRPRPLEVNRIWSRVRCDGDCDARDVRVTFYAIEPPNIGDNGNWAPIRTMVIPAIEAGGHMDASIDWVPAVGRPTAIKVWVEPQPGEISGGNNFAQENVIKFEAPASSPARPVLCTVSVCNPLDRRTVALIKVEDVPEGFAVHFPHSHVWLEPKESRAFDVAVIPTREVQFYDGPAEITITGYIPRDYPGDEGFIPAGKMMPIGGVQIRVSPKISVHLRLLEAVGEGETIILAGSIDPALPGERVRAELTGPDDDMKALQVSTDDAGRFTAAFHLPSVYAGEYPRGVYAGRACIISSDKAADGESNTVYIKR